MPRRSVQAVLLIGLVSLLGGGALVFPAVMLGARYAKVEHMKRELATLVKKEDTYRKQHGVYVAGIARTGHPVAGYQPDTSFRILITSEPKGASFYASAMSRQIPNQICAVAVDVPGPPSLPAAVNRVPGCSPDLGGQGASLPRVLFGALLSPR